MQYQAPLPERQTWLLAIAVPVPLDTQRIQAASCGWLARWFDMTAAIIPHCEESAAWLAALQSAGRSKSTIEAYHADLDRIAIALEHILGNPAVVASLSLIGQAEVSKMEALWSGEGASRATLLRRFAALRGLARFLSCSGHNCSGILAAELPLPERFPPQVAPADAIQQILEPISDSWITERDACVALVLIETGATVAEVVAIDCSHVFWEVGGLALAGGTSAERLTPVSDDALSTLKTYRNRSPFGHSNAGPLFLNRNGARLTARSVQVMIARRAKELGMPCRAPAMSVRHRYGQMLAESGHPPEIVAERMGISVSTAIKYFTLPRHRVAPVRKEDWGRRGRRPNAAKLVSTPR